MKAFVSIALVLAGLILAPVTASAHRLPTPQITRVAVTCHAGGGGTLAVFVKNWTGNLIVDAPLSPGLGGGTTPLQFNAYQLGGVLAYNPTVRLKHDQINYTRPITATPENGEGFIGIDYTWAGWHTLHQITATSYPNYGPAKAVTFLVRCR
jgi:hypothetical protein